MPSPHAVCHPPAIQHPATMALQAVVSGVAEGLKKLVKSTGNGRCPGHGQLVGPSGSGQSTLEALGLPH